MVPSISIPFPHEVDEPDPLAIRDCLVSFGLRVHVGSSFLLENATEHPISTRHRAALRHMSTMEESNLNVARLGMNEAGEETHMS